MLCRTVGRGGGDEAGKRQEDEHGGGADCLDHISKSYLSAAQRRGGNVPAERLQPAFIITYKQVNVNTCKTLKNRYTVRI